VTNYLARLARVFLAVTVLLNTPIYAADMGKEVDLTKVKLTGQDVANIFALQCSDASFKKFATWAKKNNYLTKSISVADKKATRRGSAVVFESGTEFAATANSFEIKSNGKKYTGNDLCDLFMNATAKMSARNSFSIFNTAHAEDLVKEDKTGDYIAMGVGVLGLAAVAVGVIFTAPIWIIAGGAAAVGAGLYYASNNRKRDAKHGFESVLNAPFKKPTCSEVETTIEANGYKIRVDKRNPSKFTVNILKMDPNNPKLNQLAAFDTDTYDTKGREIVAKWAKDCNNDDDEERLKTEFANTQNNVKSRLETITHRQEAIDGAVERATQ
jgi:hypothetical protein